MPAIYLMKKTVNKGKRTFQLVHKHEHENHSVITIETTQATFINPYDVDVISQNI